MGCTALKEEIEQLKREKNEILNKNKDNKEKIKELENKYKILKKENNNNIEKIKVSENKYASLIEESKTKIKKENELAEKNTKLLNELNEQKAINEQNKLEFTPQEIQKMMEDNFKKNDEIELLKTQIKNLEKEKNDLNIELNKYKEYLNSLNLPFNQFQLIPQNSPQQQNQNLIMNIVPNNDINDINNINNINNFNSNFQNNIIKNNINNINNNINNNDKVKNIIFQFENGKKYKTPINNNSKLKDVISILWLQIDPNEPIDLNKFKFTYNTTDITEHFIKNNTAASLNLQEYSIIEVIELKNLVNDNLVIFKNKQN